MKLCKQKPTHPDKDGYHYISLGLNSRKHKKFRLNRIVCQVFHPIEHPEFFEANHINGDVNDNRASNLNWLTSLENNHHSRYILHHDRCGESHPLNIYKEEFIHDICKSLENGIFYAKDIIHDIEYRNNEYLIIIDIESFQNLVMNIRSKKIWIKVSSQYNIPKLSLSDVRKKFWDSVTIENICKLIIKEFTDKQIAEMIFDDTSKHIIDYIYRIRKRGAFRYISKKYW